MDNLIIGEVPLYFKVFRIFREEYHLPIDIIELIARLETFLWIPSLLERMKGFARNRFSLTLLPRGLTWRTTKKNIAEYLLKEFSENEIYLDTRTTSIQLCLKKHTTNPNKFCDCCSKEYETGYPCDCYDNKCRYTEMIHYSIVHKDLFFCVMNLPASH